MGALSTRLCIAAMALALAVGVAACGSSNGGTSSGSTESSTATGETTTSTETNSTPDVKFEGFEASLPDCYAEPKNEPLTIGYSAPTMGNEAVQGFAKAIKLETENLGGTLITEDAQLKPDKQISDIQRMINQGVDALIVYPLDSKAVAPVMKQAEAANIPVIGYNVNVEGPNPGPGFVSQVIAQTGEAGYLLAQRMAEVVPPGSEIGLINFALPVPVLVHFNVEAKRYAEEFGLKPVAEGLNPTDDASGAETAMNEVLAEAPNIAGVIVYVDESAPGVHAAARSQGKDIVLVSAGGNEVAYQGIESGAIDTSAQYQNVPAGACAAKGAYDAAQGQKVPQAVAPGEIHLLDSENLSEITSVTEQLEALEEAGSNGE